MVDYCCSIWEFRDFIWSGMLLILPMSATIIPLLFKKWFLMSSLVWPFVSGVQIMTKMVPNIKEVQLVDMYFVSIHCYLLQGNPKHIKFGESCKNIYRKVASSNTSGLEANAGFFRLLIWMGFSILMYCDLLTKSWFPK